MIRPALLLGVALFGLSALPSALAAGEITVEDAYARAATPMARSGAAFMVIRNDGTEDDRLIGVETGAAAVAELHGHVDAGNGVLQMRALPEGIAVPAGGSAALVRGGDHVMLMGLRMRFEAGASLPLTLTFEKAGAVSLEVPVDLDRAPGTGTGTGTGTDHGTMSHGN